MARKPRVGIETSGVETAAKIGAVLTPEQIAGAGSEHSHQAAIFQWIAIEGSKFVEDFALLYAIPNGGDRSMSVGAAMKAEGVKKGVPDMHYPVPVMWHSLYIELKTPGRERTKNGGLSDDQVKWARRLRKQGHAVVVAYGWRAAVGALVAYQFGKLMMFGSDPLPVVERPDTDAALFATDTPKIDFA